MTGIRVTPEELSEASAMLMNGLNSVEATLAQLRSRIAPLKDEWRGVSQQQFDQLWADWNRSQKQLRDALSGIAQLTVQASNSYAETEQGIAQSFLGAPDED